MVPCPVHSSACPSLTRLGLGRHALGRGSGPHQPVKHSVYVHGEVLERRRCGPRIGPQYQEATRRKDLAAIGEDMPESPFDPVARYGVTDRPAHHKTHPWRLGCVRAGQQVGNNKRSSGAAAASDGFGELGAPPHPVDGRKHRKARPRSRREACAALTPTSGKDGATRAGAHAQPETVGLRAVTVIRLVRTLAHWSAPVMV